MRHHHLIQPAAAVCGTLALVGLAACGGSSSAADEKVVTVYSADGLKGENGDGWYDKVFEDFEKETGIKVEYVEGGSGEMVQRAVREKSNTQADVLVTLPPFIQQADSKGLLAAYEPMRRRPGRRRGQGVRRQVDVRREQLLRLRLQQEGAAGPAQVLGGAAGREVQGEDPVLDARRRR